MFKHTTLIGITLIFICIAANANAEAYKWIGTAGNTIYSQTPPPLGTPYEIVDSESVVSSSSSQPSTRELEYHLNSSRESRAEKQRLAESKQIQKENCNQAKSNLTALTGRGQVSIKEGDLYRKLNEKERQERIQSAKNSIDEFCK